MSNKKDPARNAFMLDGSFARKGFDWWWHSFTAVNERTGEEKPFFIEYFTCNPAKGGDQPVFGQLPENKEKGITPSYLMVKAGWWGEDHTQLHRFFGWNQVKIHAAAPYSVSAGDCFASDTRLKGSIHLSPEEAAEHPEYMCDGGDMEWDLTLEKQIAFNVGYGASGLFRAMKAFEMYWHAEGIKTLYRGTILCGKEKYTVTPETSFGYSDKNWGSGFTSPWVWLSSNDLTSQITGKKLLNSAFDIGGGRPKVFFVPLERKLLGAFTYEGTDYEFNFSKFWTGSRTEFNCRETEEQVIWHVKQETNRAVMITDITCQKKDMLLVNYEAPDGSRRHTRLWNGGNGRGTVVLYRKTGEKLELIDKVTAEKVGCEYGEYENPDGKGPVSSGKRTNLKERKEEKGFKDSKSENIESENTGSEDTRPENRESGISESGSSAGANVSAGEEKETITFRCRSCGQVFTYPSSLLRENRENARMAALKNQAAMLAELSGAEAQAQADREAAKEYQAKVKDLKLCPACGSELTEIKEKKT